MIQVKGLEYTYPGNPRAALRALDFEIADGEIFGFLGPSGAGKSTTQRILTATLPGFRGEVRVAGQDVRAAGRAFYERVGVGFETPNVFGKLTGLENLRFFRALYAGPTEDPRVLLERVGLAEDADRRTTEYSKGMKMRLGFCRALLNRPDVLFLDEPTTGQDPGNARTIKEIILDQKARGKTVFITTHDMSVARELCDRVGFLVDGELRLVDSPRDLLVRRGSRRVRVEWREEERVARREFPLDGIGGDTEFLAFLRGKNVETLHTLEPTLEDVFIEVTGRRLA